jgi:hypothetical protein
VTDDGVAGPDLLEVAATGLDDANALGDVQHLTVGVSVPVAPRSGRKEDIAYIGVFCRADLRPKPYISGELALRALGRVPGMASYLHGGSPYRVLSSAGRHV